MEKFQQAPGIAQRAGIAAVLTLIATTLARAFGGPGWLYLITGGAALLLAGAGYRDINPRLRNTSGVLLLLGCAALPFTNNPVQAIQRGIFIAGLLLSLTASVMLIARCAVQSHRIQFVGAGLRERHGRRRYIAFTLTSQFFSGILGLAGANLMFVMAAPPSEAMGRTRTDTVVAVARGFTAASCWSPVFGNMAILLALYPSLHWIEVFPIGLAVGQFTVIIGALTARVEKTGRHSDSPATPVGDLLATAFPLVISLLLFLALILAVSKTLHIVITAAIVLLAPFVSLLFHAAMAERGKRISGAWHGLGSGMQLFPRLASEALLFMAAGCAGSIMADAFPQPWAAAIGHTLSGHPFWALSFLLFGILLTALAGIHPMLSAVFLASTLTPQVLALPPIVHIAAILAGWGLSASITPFSVLSLTASRYSGVGLYQISIGKNGAFALLNALVVCAVLAVCVVLVT